MTNKSHTNVHKSSTHLQKILPIFRHGCLANLWFSQASKTFRMVSRTESEIPSGPPKISMILGSEAKTWYWQTIEARGNPWGTFAFSIAPQSFGGMFQYSGWTTPRVIIFDWKNITSNTWSLVFQGQFQSIKVQSTNRVLCLNGIPPQAMFCAFSLRFGRCINRFYLSEAPFDLRPWTLGGTEFFCCACCRSKPPAVPAAVPKNKRHPF